MPLMKASEAIAAGAFGRPSQKCFVSPFLSSIAFVKHNDGSLYYLPEGITKAYECLGDLLETYGCEHVYEITEAEALGHGWNAAEAVPLDNSHIQRPMTAAELGIVKALKTGLCAIKPEAKPAPRKSWIGQLMARKVSAISPLDKAHMEKMAARRDEAQRREKELNHLCACEDAMMDDSPAYTRKADVAEQEYRRMTREQPRIEPQKSQNKKWQNYPAQYQIYTSATVYRQMQKCLRAE